MGLSHSMFIQGLGSFHICQPQAARSSISMSTVGVKTWWSSRSSRWELTQVCLAKAGVHGQGRYAQVRQVCMTEAGVHGQGRCAWLRRVCMGKAGVHG
jgi:hypothetical protein